MAVPDHVGDRSSSSSSSLLVLAQQIRRTSEPWSAVRQLCWAVKWV